MTAPLPLRPRNEPISFVQRRWLLGGSGRAWQYLTRVPLVEVWAEHRETVVQWHAKHWPGTRPRRWWEYTAPGPRRRLGGVGMPLHECSAYGLVLNEGIPVFWRRRSDGFAEGTPIDPENPPRFESQATYLKRLGLLLPAEARRLRKIDFEPELIV